MTRPWKPSSAQATGRDGAAPVANERVCADCNHVQSAHTHMVGVGYCGSCVVQSCACRAFRPSPTPFLDRVIGPRDSEGKRPTACDDDFEKNSGLGLHAERTKDTNPKDAVGTGKAPISTVSFPVMAEVGLAMLEGARKYGRHNYRVAGVRASVYFDAVNRHMGAFWEGQDVDPDSGLSHITKAIASLVVLRDSMIQGNWIDDRPPPSPEGWLAGLNEKAAAIVLKYPDAKEAFLATDTPADTARKLGK